MIEFLSPFIRILFCIFILSITNAYSMNPERPLVTYNNKDYPLIDASSISINTNNKKHNEILVKLPHKTFSKKIEKIKFKKGFAFIKKKKKPAAAISFFDLALICQYRQKYFTQQMQRELHTQNQQQYEILVTYLNRDRQTLKIILDIAMRDSRILNLIKEEDLETLYAKSCAKVLPGKLAGRTLFIYLDRVYKELINDFNGHKNAGPLYCFALQLESLSALEFEKNWEDRGKTEYNELCCLLDPLYEAQHLIKVLDEFLGIVPLQIIYFWSGHKQSTLQVLPQEIVDHIALCSLPKRLIS